MTDDPIEDSLDDPTKQDSSPDLPAQVEGNDDEEVAEPADTGEVEGEDE